jgi:Rps23 Pro-64 3,4-dihydroxylase Tpa1-like proline 4-hydroxylase
MFNCDENKYEGVTRGGLNKKIKNTTDLSILFNSDKWNKINKLLETELKNNVKKYTEKINNLIQIHDNQRIDTMPFYIFPNNLFLVEKFMVQRYTKNEGKYVYHHDCIVDYENKRHRVLTYLWYLNDVTEGGETDFWGNKITPTTGKLLLFPAAWCFPHRGIMPISNDKYIITGWLYVAE